MKPLVCWTIIIVCVMCSSVGHAMQQQSSNESKLQRFLNFLARQKPALVLPEQAVPYHRTVMSHDEPEEENMSEQGDAQSLHEKHLNPCDRYPLLRFLLLSGCE